MTAHSRNLVEIDIGYIIVVTPCCMCIGHVLRHVRTHIHVALHRIAVALLVGCTHKIGVKAMNGAYLHATRATGSYL